MIMIFSRMDVQDVLSLANSITYLTQLCSKIPNSRQLRTDSEFRNNVYFGAHQVEINPLIHIQHIDMIKDFIVGDSLHLFDHGITKKMLTGFLNGDLGNIEAKWCADQTEMVSRYLLSIKAPYEIRAQRPDSIAKWKGIEFHNFALYVGIVVLNGILPNYMYKHFLIYLIAYTIISSERHLLNLTEVARRCLELFLRGFQQIYGWQHFTMNMHNLSHVIEDVKRFGAVNTFSTYPFEAHLYEIKRLLRSGNLPLSQVANRLIEAEIASNNNCVNSAKNTFEFVGAASPHKVDELKVIYFCIFRPTIGTEGGFQWRVLRARVGENKACTHAIQTIALSIPSAPIVERNIHAMQFKWIVLACTMNTANHKKQQRQFDVF